MSLLFKIVYAVHANGTHHKLALDALKFLKCDGGSRWQDLFLKHAALYLKGSKDPDKVFKDFKNHVYHVSDNGWGGAPAKAREWYGKTVEALKAQAYEDAVYNAGVLSHYFTDPVMPFHTAQSEAESVIHRAAEWSVAKSYGDLWKQGASEIDLTSVQVSDGADFVEDMVREAAAHSNQYYEILIAHYNFDRGVVDPPLGFSNQGQAILSKLLTYAAVHFACLLDRAIDEAGGHAPQVSLTAETVLAGLKIPVRWITNKMENAHEKKLVEAMYDELQETGTVDKTLSEDDRTIRDLHAAEVVKSDSAPDVAETIGDVRAAMNAARQVMAETAASVKKVQEKTASAPPDYYLRSGDEVEKAPSVGAKTAKRLRKAGIKTVGDLLAADGVEAAKKVGVRYICADAIASWQDQARLVCKIAKLRGTYAKLLVGAGYRNVTDIAKADPYILLNAIAAFLKTAEGQRAVGSMKEPDLNLIRDWIDRAISAAPRKAA